MVYNNYQKTYITCVTLQDLIIDKYCVKVYQILKKID